MLDQVPNYQNESALARLGTGIGGLTNTSTPTGAHMRIRISPLTPGDSTEIQPGNPEIAMSAKEPEILLTDMTCIKQKHALCPEATEDSP